MEGLCWGLTCLLEAETSGTPCGLYKDWCFREAEQKPWALGAGEPGVQARARSQTIWPRPGSAPCHPGRPQSPHLHARYRDRGAELQRTVVCCRPSSLGSLSWASGRVGTVLG